MEPGAGLLHKVLTRAQELGFLGPAPVEAQIRHAEAFGRVLRDVLHADAGHTGHAVLDLGSGGGVPGLVILSSWPALSLTFLDASERRTAFLREAIGELHVDDRSGVLLGRAEALARDPDLRAGYDAVVARSFGPPAVTAECAAGFLKVGGVLVTSEPPDSPGRWSTSGLAQLGLGPSTIVAGPPRFAVIPKVGPTSDRFPRRTGIPAKRPLF